MTSGDIAAETTILYDGPEGKVVIPHTFSAAQYWGKNTWWCIARYEADFITETSENHPAIIFITKFGKKTLVCNHRIYDAGHRDLRAYEGPTERLREAMLASLPEQKKVLTHLLLLERDLKAARQSGNKEIDSPYEMNSLPTGITPREVADPTVLSTLLKTGESPRKLLPYLRFSPALWGTPYIFGPIEGAINHLAPIHSVSSYPTHQIVGTGGSSQKLQYAPISSPAWSML